MRIEKEGRGADLIGRGRLALKAVVGDAGWCCTVHTRHPEVGTPSIKTDIQRLAGRPNSNLAVQLHIVKHVSDTRRRVISNTLSAFWKM